MLEGDIPCHVRGGQVADGCAQAQVLGAVETLTVGDVLQPAVVLVIEGRELGQNLVGNRRIHRTADLPLIEGPEGARHEAAELGSRLAGDDVDGAAGGIAAEGSALRTAQHFDPLDIKQRVVVDVLTWDDDVIDIGRNRRVQGRDLLGRAQAAQEVGVCRSCAGIVVTDQVGNGADEIDCRRNLALFQLVRRERGDCYRHALEIFRATLRGDDHLLHGGWRGLGQSGRCNCSKGRCRDCHQQDATKVHAGVPLGTPHIATVGELSEWYMFIPFKGPDKSLARPADTNEVQLMHKGHIRPGVPVRRPFALEQAVAL